MNLNDKYISRQFYNYLCDIVGSEEVVRTRRQIFSAREIAQSTVVATFISSGSKAEGIYLKGSDYDEMAIFNDYRVYESLDNALNEPEKIPLVMETNDTKPGFTKLKLDNKLLCYITNMIDDWGETVGEETFISSARFREHNLRDDMVVHGPCQSTTDGEYDGAKCFRCEEWISPAEQWVHRSRTAWPNHTIVTSAVQYGVLFVPIGYKNSPNEDLQWRISFSVTEKMLIHSFSHTQLLCYALMKIILKDLIKPNHGDLLCSYFVKTVMLWLSEETNPLEWKPENLILCFLDCIKRLIYCVEYKTCLHYFIPENNLFEDRFTYNQHKALMGKLRFIHESPWTSVFETSVFQKYRIESASSLEIVLSASELSCFRYINLHLQSNPSSFKRIVNMLRNQELCTYMLSIYSKEIIQSSRQHYVMARNKYCYKQYKKTLCYLKISLRSNSIASWLLLASLFYKYKRIQECLVIINYCLSICTPNKIHLMFNNSLVEQTVFKEMKHRCGLLFAFKHLIIDYVCFQDPFFLLPDELIAFKCSGEENILLPSVLYSYLLQFLCFHQLGDYKEKQNALHDLQQTIKKGYFILNNATTARLESVSLDIVKTLL